MSQRVAAICAAAVLFSPIALQHPSWDKMYYLVFGAVLVLLWMCVSGKQPFVKGNRIFGSLGVRLLTLAVLAGVAGEAWLRTGSSHRTIYYERRGDLPFAPLPNQYYIEKISQTPSWTDEFGMRLTPEAKKAPATSRKVLCLGDSITYGYGLADAETYPNRLQAHLEVSQPGAWQVLNGGVNAYPMSFEWQRFLQLWNLGVRPEVVIVGYSMNEGWLGPLVDADEATKKSFESRVWLKNRVRESAIYNVVMENWARLLYNRLRLKLVPGTHDVSLPMEQVGADYEKTLVRMVADIQSRNVRPVFLAFASLNGYTMKIDTAGPLQRRFVAFAKSRGIPVLESDEALKVASGKEEISGFFQDPAHMNREGADLLARELAKFLRQTMSEPTASAAQQARN